MVHDVIISGFGGQGVLSMGELLAYTAMHQGKNVTWLPAYGPEQRGGTSYCTVVISDEPVASPISSEPEAIIVLNRPSLERFESQVRAGGFIVYNSSLIDVSPTRKDVRVVAVPANAIADEIGATTVANMVMLGAFLEVLPVVSRDDVMKSLAQTISARHHNLLPLDEQALKRGAEVAQKVGKSS